VVQPNIEPHLLRREAGKLGLIITGERITYDHGRHYVAIRLERCAAKPLTDLETYMGPCLMKAKPEELFTYIEWRVRVLERASSLGKGKEKVHEERELAEAALGWLMVQKSQPDN
jgi:tRNA A22 N-methylase